MPSPKGLWPNLLDPPQPRPTSTRRKDRMCKTQPAAALDQVAKTLGTPSSPCQGSASPCLSPTASPSMRLKRTNSLSKIATSQLGLPSLRSPCSPGASPMGTPKGGARRLSCDYEDACAKMGLLPKYSRAVQERRESNLLDLSGLGFGDLQLQALLKDRLLMPVQSVSRFRLRDLRLSGAGFEAFMAKLPDHTEMLDLSRNEGGPRGATAVAAKLQFGLPQLRWLDLSLTGLRDAAMTCLGSSLLSCPLLVRLELNHNQIAEGHALGQLLGKHPRLARLSLHGNSLCGHAGAALFNGVKQNASKGGQIADLDVAWNHLGDAGAASGAEALAEALRVSVTLYHLDLSYNNLGAASCQVIAQGLRDNHHLYGLHIVGNAATIDADGFVSPNHEAVPTQKMMPSPRGRGAQPQLFGELRQGNEDRLGASARPSTADAQGQQDVATCVWSDEDVLRERDVLEQQTTCWACEGWERHELVWMPAEGEQIPKAVWAFTSIDGFRAGLRLKEEKNGPVSLPIGHWRERQTGNRFVAARMIPRSCRVLVIFQVDSALRLPAGCEIEDLATPIEIELRACEELPILAPPPDQEVVVQESRHAGKALEHRLVLRTPRAALLRSALSARGSGCAQRSVLLDGPDGTGPVQMPRITETEFRMRTKLPRGPAFYAAFRRETDKVVQECFLLDWSRAKVARLVSKDPDRQDTQQLLASNYRKLVALYRDLSCLGTTGETGFGVTQLEASALLTQAGLVDDTTRVSDIDRCFIAAKVLPVDMRKAGVRLANDKVLNRHQFLELLLRVADQRCVQTGRVKSVSEALSQVLEPLLPVGQAKVAEVDAILDALHTEEVDDVMKKYHGTLQEVYRRFSGRVTPPGVAKFMSFGEFQELWESSHSLTPEFTQRRVGFAFRVAMMTQSEEMLKTRFQEMNFVEFQHAVGVAAFLRGQTARGLADGVEGFIREKLVPIAHGR